MRCLHTLLCAVSAAFAFVAPCASLAQAPAAPPAATPPTAAPAAAAPDYKAFTSGFKSYDQLKAALNQLVAAHPAQASVATLALTAGKRDIMALTLSGDIKSADDRPGLLIVAGMDGTMQMGSDVVLDIARNLLEKNGEALKDVTVYIVPRANPDAAELFRAMPNPRGALNTRPVDEDRDGRIDEDGPRDLDGDGVITLIRKLDPPPSLDAPTLVADPKDPRILRAPDKAKGEIARYSVWTEGIDADGDGLIAEDGLGGVDPDLNFPYRWPEFDRKAGQYQLSEPESMSLARFVFEHPRLFAVYTLGRHDNLVNVPDSRARDVTGRQPNFLDEGDAPIWGELAKLYREKSGQSRASGGDPAGSFELWAYVQRGLPSFASTMWGRPNASAPPKAEGKEEAKPESTESKDEAKPEVAAGSEGAAASQAAPPAPPPGADAPRGGGRGAGGAGGGGAGGGGRRGQQGGAQGAAGGQGGPGGGGLRRGGRGGAAGAGAGPRGGGDGGAAADAPSKDSLPSDEEATAWLAYSDRDRGGAGFVPWRPYKHPQLGDVEIGGFVPGFRQNPPPEVASKLAEGQEAWVASLIEKRPKLVVSDPEIRTLADGLYEVGITIENQGGLPVNMRPGRQDGMARPIVLRVTTPLDKVKSGRRVDTVRGLDPGTRHTARWLLAAGSDPFDIIVSHPFLGQRTITVKNGAITSQVTTPGVYPMEVPSPTLYQQGKPVAMTTKAGDQVNIAWDRFYNYDEMTDLLRQLNAAYPELTQLKDMGPSVEGRAMWVFIINNPKTGADTTKPAMYIDGNIHANEIQAGETVLYSIWYLLKSYGKVPKLTELMDNYAFYMIPMVNPDGRAAWFREPNTPSSQRSGRKPTDTDGDGLFDEDGPEDLDGDGSIGQMWRKDPFGTHKRDPRDPRLLIPVSSEPRADGTREYGEWSYAGEEGIDNDGDGRINEDPPGGYDMNRNWPSDWQPNHIQSGAGPWPLYYPEAQAIAAFVLAHPNIAAGQAFHNAGGMILHGPGANYRENEYPARDRAVYDSIAKVGEEMLPFYRNMIIWSDLYTVHGGLVDWLAEGLGIITFTNELWTDKRILQNGQDPTQEQRQHWQDRMLFGQTFTDWKEMQHPDLGVVLIGGGTKYSSRIPPGFMLEEECHRNFAFTMFHASQMPILRWECVETKALGNPADGIWEVNVSIADDKLIPSRTGRAADKKIGEPDRLTLSGDGVQVLTSGSINNRFDRTFDPRDHLPAVIPVDDGIPGNGSRWFRFIVKGPKGGAVKLRYEAEKAKVIETSIKLGESTLPPPDPNAKPLPVAAPINPVPHPVAPGEGSATRGQ